MSISPRIILIAAGAFIGLLVLVAVFLRFFVDVNVYKPQLEAAASRALGMDVKVSGRLGIGFYPDLLVTLKEVRIRNQEMVIATAKEARLGVEFLPLLMREVRIRKIALKQANIVIERGLDGKFSFEKPESTGETKPALNLAVLSVTEGALRYADKQSGEKFEAEACGLDARRLWLAEGKGADFLKHLSLSAQLSCGAIRKNNFMLTDLTLSVDGKSGVFNLTPITMQLFGGQGLGSIQADFSGAVPLYHVRYDLSQFPIETFIDALSLQKIAAGLVDFSANLSMQGRTLIDMKQTADGDVSLRGENLVLNGNDIDKKLSRFESSQNFNLVDVGAFFFAGPLGLAVTKGYNFVSIFQGSGGHSDIRLLVSDWKLEHGVAQARDVAMATHQNRIALQGGLDFVNERFNDLSVAVIDAKGCAMVRQKIRGSFQKPVVEQPKILKSLTGPAISLLKKGRDLFPGGKCDVFYEGIVVPPKA